ncbi:MAG: hypothetical protein KDA25_05265 [Phycisphaerales bacterium]|nr:hypothetical protein [Phycisphaerales bacterium]
MSVVATESGSARHARYRATVVATSRASVWAACNRAMDRTYGPGVDDAQPMAYPMVMYDELLRAFAAMPRIEVVTLRDLCHRPAAPGRVRLAIRHDVDGDIVAAWQMAHLEASHGMPSSYYMLHTAPYHARFDGGQFERHGCIAYVYREIQSLGHEIGLHTDGLTVYQQYDMDGAAAVRDEIEWLRAEGIDVRGTVAHGSAAAYGAENFEIFKGRRKGEPKMADAASDPVRTLRFNGADACLSVLDEGELGLEYEGNDIFRQKDARVEYGATRSIDGWRWNRVLRAHRADESDFGPPFCTQARMLADIAALEPGVCVVLTVHPCYYGLREGPDRAPVRRRCHVTSAVHPELGWTTHVPGSRVAWTSSVHEPQAYQSVHVVNRWGMLDREPEARASMRIVSIGSGLLHGATVGSPSQMHRELERMLGRAGIEAWCSVLAMPRMGVSRWWGWLASALAGLRPTHVLLGLGSREARDSVPAAWSVETGFSMHHPPGDYLAWTGDTVEPVRRSAGWRIRQRTARDLACWPGTERSIDAGLSGVDDLKVDRVPVARYLEACYRRAVDDVRASGAWAGVLITDAGADPASTRAFAARVASACAASVTDPTAAIGALGASMPGRHADGTLAADGHRAAARAVFDHLVASGQCVVHSIGARRSER